MTVTNLRILYQSRIDLTLGGETELLNKRLTMNIQSNTGCCGDRSLFTETEMREKVSHKST